MPRCPLILDLRRNQGGDDEAVAHIASHFDTRESVFEYAEYFDEDTGKFEIPRSGTLYVTPRRPHFNGLVNRADRVRYGKLG